VLDFLVTLLIVVLILGLVAYVIRNFFPLDPKMQQLAMLIIGVIFLIWLIFALLGQAPVWHWQGPPPGRVR
jgi:hypothetical protein